MNQMGVEKKQELQDTAPAIITRLETDPGIPGCPFCGEDVTIDKNYYSPEKPDDWDAYCAPCLIGFTRSTKEEAIAAWSRRV